MKSFCKSFFKEFQCKYFGFEHNNVEEFFCAQWQSNKQNVFYLIYRWLWCTFFACVYGTILILQFNEGKVFIFLTNWGILLCLVTNLCAAILVTQWYFDLGATRTSPLSVTIENNETTEKIQRISWLIKVYWLLHCVTLPLALIITTVYWIFLYGKMNKPNHFPVLSFVTHCLNSVFMGIDFWIVAFPVRLLHTTYAMLLPIIFCGFTVVYYFLGGTDDFGNPYVYPITYWKYPQRGITTFAGVFVLYVIYGVLLYLLYKLKRKIHIALLNWKPHAVDIF